MMLHFTDRAELEAREKVEAIQDNLLEAMLYVLKCKYEDRHMSKFAQLVDVLTSLRNVTELYLKLTNTLITKISDMPPLLTEILSLSWYCAMCRFVSICLCIVFSLVWSGCLQAELEVYLVWKTQKDLTDTVYL